MAPRKFNVDDKVHELEQTTVTIAEKEYHPVPITTVEAKVIKGLVRKIRRAGRRAELVDAEVQKLEDDGKFEDADKKQEEADRLEAEAEGLTHQLLAAQLVSTAGDHPDPKTIASKVPAQVQRALFEFLAGEVEDDEAVDPQKSTTTGPTTD